MFFKPILNFSLFCWRWILGQSSAKGSNRDDEVIQRHIHISGLYPIQTWTPNSLTVLLWWGGERRPWTARKPQPTTIKNPQAQTKKRKENRFDFLSIEILVLTCASISCRSCKSRMGASAMQHQCQKQWKIIMAARAQGVSQTKAPVKSPRTCLLCNPVWWYGI